MFANGGSIRIVRQQDADFLVGLEQLPLRDIALVKFLHPEAEVVGPLERRGLAGLGPAPEIPGFPRHDGGEARNPRGLAGVGDRVDHFRRGNDQHHVDGVGVDERLGELARSRRIRLAVPIENLDLVGLAGDGISLGERLAHDVQDVAVGLPKAAQSPGSRAHEADLELGLRAGGERAPRPARGGEARGPRGKNEAAPRYRWPGRGQSPGVGYDLHSLPPIDAALTRDRRVVVFHHARIG